VQQAHRNLGGINNGQFRSKKGVSHFKIPLQAITNATLQLLAEDRRNRSRLQRTAHEPEWDDEHEGYWELAELTSLRVHFIAK